MLARLAIPGLAILAASAAAAALRAPAPVVNVVGQSASLVQDGCAYEVTSVQQPLDAGVPPLFDTVLTRTDVGGCKLRPASKVVNSSYLIPTVGLDASRRHLAVTSTFKYTPSGSAAIFLRVVGLDLRSLEVENDVTFGAMGAGMGSGIISSGDPRILGNLLVVSGTFSGVIPGAYGSGERYVAIYPGFFSGAATAPLVLEY